MKEFFKMFFASCLGITAAGILLIIILFGFFASLISEFEEEPTAYIRSKSVLHLTFNRPILDRSPENPFYSFEETSGMPMGAMGLDDILMCIKRAKNDDNIEGIYLNPSSFIDAGYSTVGEIRNALKQFKVESGKFIISFAEDYSQKSYYLASVADEVYVNPKGDLEFRGLAVNVAFFTGLLEKLDIKAEILRQGKFKSAVEPFMLQKLSAENRLQMETMFGSLWSSILTEIGESRNIDVAELNRIADRLSIRTAEDAKKFGLIDGFKYDSDMKTYLKDYINQRGITLVDFDRYKRSSPTDEEERHRISEHKIAVIYASGYIHRGNSYGETIGSDTFIDAIRTARDDSDTKAIVLRVNSPGGDALASEIIWNELMLAKAEKPVVISMGDLAASGGYYISCASSYIFATDKTLTGSIGVFGILLKTQDFWENKLGVTFDQVKTNRYADLYSSVKPLSEYEREYITEDLDKIYTTFTTRVADNRDMPIDEVEKISMGRVWNGKDAVDIGLVDEIGGLEQAIEKASQLARVRYFRTLRLPVQQTFFDRFITGLANTSAYTVMKEEFGVFGAHLDAIAEILEWDTFQMRLPYRLEIN